MDAGFAAGDEVSAHYDPMIAKLIVQGHTRTIAIRKLHMALEQYEISGLITNIEFLKKICLNSAFVAGDVETGFIIKHKNALFVEGQIAPEVYAQAALGSFFNDAMSSQDEHGLFSVPQSGFCSTSNRRSFNFVSSNAKETAVHLKQLDTGLFGITIDGNTYSSVASRWDSESRRVISFFPHTRLETRLITDDGNLTLFQQGQQYRLRYATPAWVDKALGVKDTTHSVLAPMPCKILRVEANAGDAVKKEQALVVIESMKMETIIRSPQDGIISRVVHQQGVGTR